MAEERCCCPGKRLRKPGGLWDLVHLLGAKVRVKSMPVGNFPNTRGDKTLLKNLIGTDKVCTIENIQFRISTDGKTITVITLLEFPTYIWTWKDLEVVGLEPEDTP